MSGRFRAAGGLRPVGVADAREIVLLERLVAGMEGLREDLANAVALIAESSNCRPDETSEPVQHCDRLLSQREVAGLLGVDERTLREMRHDGTAPPWVQVGRRARWRAADVEAWIAQRRVS